ncbi:TetR family transcriptional regulator (plasmid) [Streptomyces sp. NBC_01450]|uniref:TetR family transcriptional regulator n=1 Tax=Streptomyces sp. NBC_01450 TaxID=2903871 RepID=UPI002E361131|nr:TetR family transcriptional regulator [Streptomyces sp. NBC_01450]
MDTTEPPAFQRARSPEHRERRARDLLQAAAELAQSGGTRTVTLKGIAQRAGVHASAVRGYFASREEILLRLATASWQAWSRDLTEQLSEAGPLDADGLARSIAASLAEHSLFCDLLAHAAVSLEREVPIDCLHEYKSAAIRAVDELADAFHRALPALSRADGREVVAAATALAPAFWQYANPGETLELLYERVPQLASARCDFEPRMTVLLTALINGLTGPRT